MPPFPEREGGCVLSATINRYAYASLRPRADGQIGVQSLDFGESVTYGESDLLVYDGKLDLVKAAILRLRPDNSQGFDLFLHSDAPPGSGLGASSAVMVALVGLLRSWRNLSLTDYEIADLAYRLEREELAIRGGLQDHYASTFGGFNFIEFFGDRVVVNSLRIPDGVMNELQYRLLLVFTGQIRLSARIIEDQTGRYEAGEVASLEGLRALKDLTVEMKSCLLGARLDEFGELLHEEWRQKRRLSPRISTPHLDAMYEAAREAGALGGKITGAGGGGFMLLDCGVDRKHVVAARLAEMGGRAMDFSFESDGVQTWTGA